MDLTEEFNNIEEEGDALSTLKALYISSLASSTDKAVAFITRGAVRIKIDGLTYSIDGEKSDVAAYNKFQKDKKNAKEMADRFGWSYEIDEKGSMTGEFVTALILYLFLMEDLAGSGGEQSKIYKSFLKDIKLSI